MTSVQAGEKFDGEAKCCNKGENERPDGVPAKAWGIVINDRKKRDVRGR
jgi:hypothetical protein